MPLFQNLFGSIRTLVPRIYGNFRNTVSRIGQGLQTAGQKVGGFKNLLSSGYNIARNIPILGDLLRGDVGEKIIMALKLLVLVVIYLVLLAEEKLEMQSMKDYEELMKQWVEVMRYVITFGNEEEHHQENLQDILSQELVEDYQG